MALYYILNISQRKYDGQTFVHEDVKERLRIIISNAKKHFNLDVLERFKQHASLASKDPATTWFVELYNSVKDKRKLRRAASP